MKKFKKYLSRKWLNNDKTQPGFIICQVHPNQGRGSASVKIGDCSRRVDLDFDWGSDSYEETLATRVEKLDLLISELTKMRAVMAGAVE